MSTSATRQWFVLAMVCTTDGFVPSGGSCSGLEGGMMVDQALETIVVLALFPSVGWDGAEEPATRINVGVEELVAWFPGVGYSQP